jgi:hypothetical protein
LIREILSIPESENGSCSGTLRSHDWFNTSINRGTIRKRGCVNHFNQLARLHSATGGNTRGLILSPARLKAARLLDESVV